MWEIDIELQIFHLGLAAALGGIFCLLYDLFRAIRLAVKCSDIAVFFQDILYFCILAPVTFCFLLSTTNGQVRGYIIFGIVTGFAITRCTLSFLLMKIYSFLLKWVFAFFGAVKRIKEAVFTRIEAVAGVFRTKTEKNLKKAVNTLKKLLKKQ